MVVDSIATLAELDTLREKWEKLHAADEHAHVFLAWSWLRGWFENQVYPWEVLVVRSGGEITALLPLQHCGRRTPGFIPSRTTRLGGYPYADYNGLLCCAGQEQSACGALVRHLESRADWDELELSDGRDPRLELLVRQFQRGPVDVGRRSAMVCPRVCLPESWEEFERTRLSRMAAKNLRYLLRRLEQQPGYVVGAADDEAFDSEVDLALRLWASRWENVKPADCERIGRILRSCHHANLVWLRVVRINEEPIAALVGLLDYPRQAFRYFLSGFSEAYARLSPGRCVQALAIRAAIDFGLRSFDFLRGSEPYKYAFGATPIYLTNVLIRRRTAKRTALRIAVTVARRIWRRD